MRRAACECSAQRFQLCNSSSQTRDNTQKQNAFPVLLHICALPLDRISPISPLALFSHGIAAAKRRLALASLGGVQVAEAARKSHTGLRFELKYF
jgi:hypothetical protein